MSRQRGFSLMEMAVATALLGVAAVALLGLIGSSVSAAGAARDRESAAMTAKSRMHELLVSDRPAPGETVGERRSDGSGWTASAEEVDGFDADQGDRRLVRIRLELWWSEGGERRTMRLDGYRRPQTR